MIPDFGHDCDGACINDSDEDGVCDGIRSRRMYLILQVQTSIQGLPMMTVHVSLLVVSTLACNYNGDADYMDITQCDFSSCIGCIDELACNFNADATINDQSICEYPENVFIDCEGVCINDIDGDGICDENEIPGCMDPTASNYNPDATDDNGTCIPELMVVCIIPFACNYDPMQITTFQDHVFSVHVMEHRKVTSVTTLTGVTTARLVSVSLRAV